MFNLSFPLVLLSVHLRASLQQKPAQTSLVLMFWFNRSPPFILVSSFIHQVSFQVRLLCYWLSPLQKGNKYIDSFPLDKISLELELLNLKLYSFS
jgi:hypothetical protein